MGGHGPPPCVTVQFGCQFLDAVQAGDFVELDAEVLRRSSTVVFMRGTLRVGSRVTGAVEGIWEDDPPALTVHEKAVSGPLSPGRRPG